MNKQEWHTKSVVDSWEEWICNDSLGLDETPMEFVASCEELISRLQNHIDSAIANALPDPMDEAKYN